MLTEWRGYWVNAALTSGILRKTAGAKPHPWGVSVK